MTRNGYVVCNQKFVKVRDEKGLVNYNGRTTEYNLDELKRDIQN
jgi:hypothetical protein